MTFNYYVHCSLMADVARGDYQAVSTQAMMSQIGSSVPKKQSGWLGHFLVFALYQVLLHFCPMFDTVSFLLHWLLLQSILRLYAKVNMPSKRVKVIKSFFASAKNRCHIFTKS